MLDHISVSYPMNCVIGKNVRNFLVWIICYQRLKISNDGNKMTKCICSKYLLQKNGMYHIHFEELYHQIQTIKSFGTQKNKRKDNIFSRA